MSPTDRAYEVYCSIARQALGREPMPRERWDAIPRRGYFRTCTLPRHDDTEFDNHKERDGDAQ